MVLGTGQVDRDLHLVGGKPQLAVGPPAAVVGISHLRCGHPLLSLQVVFVYFPVHVLVDEYIALIGADLDTVGQGALGSRQQPGAAALAPAPHIPGLETQQRALRTEKVIGAEHAGIDDITVGQAYHVIDQGIVGGEYAALPLQLRFAVGRQCQGKQLHRLATAVVDHQVAPAAVLQLHQVGAVGAHLLSRRLDAGRVALQDPGCCGAGDRKQWPHAFIGHPEQGDTAGKLPHIAEFAEQQVVTPGHDGDILGALQATHRVQRAPVLAIGNQGAVRYAAAIQRERQGSGAQGTNKCMQSFHERGSIISRRKARVSHCCAALASDMTAPV